MTDPTPEALLAEALRLTAAGFWSTAETHAAAMLAHPPLAQALAHGLAPDGLALREALEAIRDGQGIVCDDYTVCEHRSCASSYDSWAIADRALRDHPPTVAPDTLDAATLVKALSDVVEASDAWVDSSRSGQALLRLSAAIERARALLSDGSQS